MKKQDQLLLSEAYAKILESRKELLNEMPYKKGSKASDIEPAFPAAKKDVDLADNPDVASAKEAHFGPEEALNDANIPIDFTKTVFNVDDKERFKTLLTNPKDEGKSTDYGKMYGSVYKHPERRNKISRLMLGIADAVFASIEEAEGNVLPDTRGEMQARIATIVKGMTGWSESASIHPARQILQALVDANIIEELEGSTARSTGSGEQKQNKSNPKHIDF